MTPRVLQPTELKNYWPELRYGLEEVLCKTPSAAWIPEDVYSAVQAKKAICVMGMKDEEIEGFFVGYPQTDGTFFVWAVWSAGNLGEGVKHLIDFVKQTKCVRIKFQTDRKGWNRVAQKYGFQPDVWRLEI